MTASKKRLNRWAMALAALGGLALFAQAEDFTFNIPVELHKIHPNIKSASINVVVYTQAYVPALEPYNGPLQVDSRVGYGSGWLQFVDGEYVGTVVVKFDALSKTVPGKRAQDGFYYEIVLILRDSYYDNDTAGVARMLDGTYGYDSSKPFVYWASGKIHEPKRVSPKFEKAPLIIKR